MTSKELLLLQLLCMPSAVGSGSKREARMGVFASSFGWWENLHILCLVSRHSWNRYLTVSWHCGFLLLYKILGAYSVAWLLSCEASGPLTLPVQLTNHCHWASRVDFYGHFSEKFYGFAMSLQTRRGSAMSKFLSFLWEVVLTTSAASSGSSALSTMEPICYVMVPLPTENQSGMCIWSSPCEMVDTAKQA